MATGMSRRQFLQTGTLGAAALAAGPLHAAPAVGRSRQPNILFINVDQLNGNILSSHGCTYVNTPNIDRLLARGISFRESYSANPVCCPARAAWFTGRPPSENGVVINDVYPIDENMPDLGQWFSARGYESFYAGKWHVSGRNFTKSFQVLTNGSGIGENTDSVVSRAAQGFLLNHTGDKPFFLTLGFLQPHDICYWVFQNSEPPAKLPYPELEDELPPLQDNFNFDPREPERLKNGWRNMKGNWQYMSRWPDWLWRYYRWAYYRHVEMVDAQVGRVLDALEDSPYADNTLVVFCADHGDGMGCHHLHQKMYFYEEAALVPFVISWPGEVAQGVQDRTHLVSGLDLATTLCDYAGIDAPPKARGRSLRPLAQQQSVPWREFIVSEVSITGRMVRTPEWKLITYSDSPTQQLFDMRNDRGEMRNLWADGTQPQVVADLHKRLDEWEATLEPLNLEGRMKPRQMNKGSITAASVAPLQGRNAAAQGQADKP
jgi:arylsulfatase A-like enzyme